MKTLRRLRPPQPVARHCSGHGFRALPQRIGHGQGRGGARMIAQRGNHRVNDPGRNAGAGHIVDQHQIGRLAQGLKPGKHRSRAGLRPGHDLQIHPPAGRPMGGVAVGGHHQHDAIDGRMAVKGIDRPLRHALPGHGAPLLGQAAARAHATPGRDDQRGDTGRGNGKRIRHGLVIGAGRAPHNGAQ